MDNLTHSIIGLIAGEAIVMSGADSRSRLPPRMRRALFLTIGVVGGNLPDLDLLLAVPGGASDSLPYLLQHRGYTHTIPGCIALAVLMFAATQVWLRWRGLAGSGRDRLQLLLWCLVAVGLHLGMDALNSYGVHPFWPWRNDWSYGDAVFIVEPLYWAAAAPLLFCFHSRWARGFIVVSLVGAVLLSLLSGLVLPMGAAFLAALITVLLVVASRSGARVAAWTSAAVMLLVTTCFVCAARVAEHRAQNQARHLSPSWQLLDTVLTPAPVNPLCWDVLLLQADDATYSIRHGRLSLLPSMLPVSRCPSIDGSDAAPVPRYTAADDWLELSPRRMRRELLSQLDAGNCRAAALLRFARAPFVWSDDKGLMVGDARFHRDEKPGFADVRLAAANAACPPIPPWNPPRADLLRR